MKQDKLEQFVSDHADDFDVFEPDDNLWENINNRSHKVRKINFSRIAWRVAAGVAIFVASWLLNDLVEKGEKENINVAETVVPNSEKMKMLMEAEMYYSGRIKTAREEIYKISGNDNELMEILDFDLIELDKVFEELKNDLKDNSDNQEVIEAMIQNYRLKLEILEEILKQLNKSGQKENKISSYEI